jgi:hypothetical protein
MGVDLSCIIRNRFKDRSDNAACEKYLKETIDRLAKRCHVAPSNFQIEHEEYNGWHTWAITTQLWDIARIHLCSGMWMIDCAVHYCQLFFKNQYWRLMLQEIADALGQKELWLCDEFCTDNSPFMPKEIDDMTFEEWKERIIANVEGCKNGIPDYPTEEVMETPDNKFYSSLEAYHDTTEMYLQKIEAINLRIRGYKALGFSGVGKFIPMEREGELYLVNPNTKEILFDRPIEAYKECLNHAGFVVVKDGKNVLCDNSGNILSAPTDGEFDWRWEECKEIYTWEPAIIISNEELGKEWRYDCKTGITTEVVHK